MSIKTYLPLTYAIDEDYKSDKFIKLRMRICHDGKNPNGSAFTINRLEERKDSLCESPILAHIYNDENDVPTIGGHDFLIEENKFDDSSDKIVYLEQPVGVIPADNNFEITEDNGVHYVNVDGYIWRGYSNYCEEIISRYDELKISMEVDVLSYSYNASDDCYNITDFIYKAVTLLNESYNTGMKNARASIKDFSLQDTSFETIQKELTNELSLTNDKQKGEIELKLEDILKDYSLPIEELDFEITEDMDEATIRGLLDDFVSRKSANESEQQETDSPAEAPAEVMSNANETSNEGDSAEVVDSSATTEPASEAPAPDFEVVIDTEEDKVEVQEEPVVRTNKREISVNEKFNEIYNKLYDLGIDAYVIDLYDSYFIYDEWEEGTHKQFYHIDDNGEIVFDGAPVKVWAKFLTEDELAAVEALNADYSKLKAENEELVAYKARVETEKRNTSLDSIFAKFDKELGEVADYVKLKDSESNADMSVEDIENKCYALLGRKTAKFSVNKKEDSNTIRISTSDTQIKVNAPYGGLFEKYNN